jgi:glycosyltransferase involved in cell wall biosynthesis
MIYFISGRSYGIVDGKAVTYQPQQRLYHHLADLFGELSVVAPLSSSPLEAHESTISSSIGNIPLPDMITTRQAAPKSISVARILQKLPNATGLIIQVPFPVPLSLLAVPRVPLVVHAVGDVLAVVTAANVPGMRGVLERTYAWIAHQSSRSLLGRSDSSLVANGTPLLASLGGGRGSAIVSSTLDLEDFTHYERCRSDNNFRILYAGYVRREKGLEFLYEAVKIVGRLGHGIELRVVGAAGPGYELPDSEEMSRSLGVQVTFSGHLHRDALFQEYSDADVLVLPSLSEGTPRVLVEARAFGCPVIATAVGGVPDSVTEGVDGLLVEPRNPEAIALAIVRLIDDSELRDRLQSVGQHRARSYTVRQMALTMATALRNRPS